MLTKKCTKCSCTKDLSEFHKHRFFKDGHTYICKACAKKHRREHYLKNRERQLAQNKEWKNNNEERNRELQKEHKRKLRSDPVKNALLLRAVRKWTRQNPQKKTAQDLVKYRINKKGDRPQSCPICKREGATLAHHEDYSKPLEVVFCCYVCHKKIHNKKLAVTKEMIRSYA